MTAPHPTDRTAQDVRTLACQSVLYAASRHELARRTLHHHLARAIASGVTVDELVQLTGMTRNQVLTATDPATTP